MGFFEKIKAGLTRTKENIGHSFDQLFAGELNDDFYDELEESLILADTGMDTTLELVEELRRRVREERIKTVEEARTCMCRCIADAMQVGDPALDLSTKPSVVLFIGVNGVGKTTTIGKIGAQLKKERKKVLLCAADTFRAAAAEQLTIWADRSGLEIIRQHEGADPAAVVFDAASAAKARNTDVVLVDTAGRLHNKQNLMNELNKISRVIDRELPGCAKETLLVLDATGITGIVLTKLDGTAKGGIAIAIARELGVPVKYAGVGEGIDDLRPFDALEFAQALI